MFESMTPELTAILIATSCILLLQFVGIFRPVFKKIKRALMSILIKRYSPTLKFNFYHPALTRSYVVNTYKGIFKEKKNRQELSLFELFILLQTLKKEGEANKVHIDFLISTIESLDGKANLNISQVAKLISITENHNNFMTKARKGYSYEELIESADMPIDWSDAVYNKS